MMNENILITINSTQYAYNETDTEMQTVQHGIYKYISNKHIITYEEFINEKGYTPTSVKNLLKIDSNDEKILLTKRGTICTDMVFKKDFIFTGTYKTPFGTLKMGIITSSLIIEEKSDSINAIIKYSLELNCQHASDCNIIIKVSNIP